MSAVVLRCGGCQARLGAEARWCGRCLAPVPAPEEPPSFAHPDACLAPPLPTSYSRWKATSVSFGPAGRILATVLVCVMPLWWSLSYSFVMAIMWVFVVIPMSLRSIWKKTHSVG